MSRGRAHRRVVGWSHGGDGHRLGSVSRGCSFDELAVDGLELTARGSLEGVCDGAVGVAEATAGCLVEHGERIDGTWPTLNPAAFVRSDLLLIHPDDEQASNGR